MSAPRNRESPALWRGEVITPGTGGDHGPQDPLNSSHRGGKEEKEPASRRAGGRRNPADPEAVRGPRKWHTQHDPRPNEQKLTPFLFFI